MIQNLFEELRAQNDLVLEFARQGFLLRVSGIPDPGFAHKTEACPVNHGSFLALRVGSEEDRRAEDPLESSHQAPILSSALLHAEGVRHFRGTPESDHPA